MISSGMRIALRKRNAAARRRATAARPSFIRAQRRSMRRSFPATSMASRKKVMRAIIGAGVVPATAVVVLRPGTSATPRELLLSLRGRIADYKIPNGYVFVDYLPRNPTGKVLRRVLRDETTASAR